MEYKEIFPIIDMYRKRLEHEKIPQIRMDADECFSSLTKEEILAHAYYLIGIFKTHNKKDIGKINRHFASIQMCLSFSGLYTLNELRDHNYRSNGN